MSRALILVMSLFIAGCIEYEKERTIKRVDYICNESTVEKRADFTLNCISGANPKSDEEPEDWIRLCQRMAMKNYCPEKSVVVAQYRNCSQCLWSDSAVTVVESK